MQVVKHSVCLSIIIRACCLSFPSSILNVTKIHFLLTILKKYCDSRNCQFPLVTIEYRLWIVLLFLCIFTFCFSSSSLSTTDLFLSWKKTGPKKIPHVMFWSKLSWLLLCKAFERQVVCLLVSWCQGNVMSLEKVSRWLVLQVYTDRECCCLLCSYQRTFVLFSSFHLLVHRDEVIFVFLYKKLENITTQQLLKLLEQGSCQNSFLISLEQVCLLFPVIPANVGSLWNSSLGVTNVYTFTSRASVLWCFHSYWGIVGHKTSASQLSTFLNLPTLFLILPSHH